jgi:uncharacterized membrane protein
LRYRLKLLYPGVKTGVRQKARMGYNKDMKRLHLILYSSTLGVIIASFIMSVWLYSGLPATIPVHFGLSGSPDAWATRSLIYIFMVPTLNLLMYLFFLFIYRYPQYTSWPTTLILMTVEETRREKIFEILRSMVSWLLFWVTLLFGYLQYTILATANGRSFGILNYIMIAFLVVMFIFLIYINAKMYLAIRKMVKTPRRKAQ